MHMFMTACKAKAPFILQGVPGYDLCACVLDHGFSADLFGLGRSMVVPCVTAVSYLAAESTQSTAMTACVPLQLLILSSAWPRRPPQQLSGVPKIVRC